MFCHSTFEVMFLHFFFFLNIILIFFFFFVKAVVHGVLIFLETVAIILVYVLSEGVRVYVFGCVCVFIITC